MVNPGETNKFSDFGQITLLIEKLATLFQSFEYPLWVVSGHLINDIRKPPKM